MMRATIAIVGFLGLLLCGATAGATNCNAVAFRGHAVNYHGNHHAITYANQLLVPIVVPHDTFAVTGPARYPAAGVASGEELLRLQLENSKLKLQAAERDLEEHKNYTRQVLSQGAAAAPKLGAVQTSAPPEPSASVPSAAILNLVAVNILKMQCASCHTGAKSRGPKSRGPVQIFDKLDNYALINTDPAEIWDVIESNHMPLGADDGKRPPLPDHERAWIQAWASQAK